MEAEGKEDRFAEGDGDTREPGVVEYVEAYRSQNCDWHAQGSLVMVVFCPVITRLAVAWLSSRGPTNCLCIHPGALDTRAVKQVQQDPQRMVSPIPCYPHHNDNSPSDPAYLSLPVECSWWRMVPWCNFPTEKDWLF